jgi:hypothetical protein
MPLLRFRSLFWTGLPQYFLFRDEECFHPAEVCEAVLRPDLEEETILVAEAILQSPVWRIGEETELVTARMVRSLLLASPRAGPSPVQLKQCLGPQRNGVPRRKTSRDELHMPEPGLQLNRSDARAVRDLEHPPRSRLVLRPAGLHSDFQTWLDTEETKQPHQRRRDADAQANQHTRKS